MTETWLRCRAPRDHPAVRLVCLPHAAGPYAAWGPRLPDEVELSAVQYPGREDRLSEPARGDMHTRPDDDLVAELVRLGGTSGDLLADPAVRSAYLPAVRADLQARGAHHRPVSSPALRCPVTAVMGEADTEVDEEQARAWAVHTSGPFALGTFPGGHLAGRLLQGRTGGTGSAHGRISFGLAHAHHDAEPVGRTLARFVVLEREITLTSSAAVLRADGSAPAPTVDDEDVTAVPPAVTVS